MRASFAIPCVILQVACATFAAEFTGRVVEVHDGDTLRFVHDGRTDQVRLYGVDAPDPAQPFGAEAKKAVEELALGRSVTLKPWGLDRYGRLVGVVLLPDGRSLNHALVRAGLARWDRRYPDDALAEGEARARAECLGVWSIGKEDT